MHISVLYQADTNVEGSRGILEKYICQDVGQRHQTRMGMGCWQEPQSSPATGNSEPGSDLISCPFTRLE